MGDLVCDGTEFSCPHCTSSLKLCVSSSLAQGETKNIANLINGHFPPPGGMCLIKNACCNPDVQVADPGQNVVQVDNKTALGAGCKYSCSHGGTLQPTNPGQGVGQHVKTEREKPKPILCKNLRTEILNAAHAIVNSAKTTYYTEDPVYREGSTPPGEKAHIQYHEPNIHGGPHHKIKSLPVHGPLVSFDCSGFVSKVFRNIGKPLKDYGAGTNYPNVRVIYYLRVFTKHPPSEALPGDLVVWLKDGAHHVGIVEEDKKSFISALVNIGVEDKEKQLHVYKTSLRPISINSFSTHSPQILRFTDCIGP